tara:strand:- start:245 stop:481 length:237 start_codon:yes stop_codon:yes gene_type:complete
MTVLLAKVVQKAVVKVNQFMEQGVKQYIARNISMLQKLELKKEEKILQTLKWGIQNQDQKIRYQLVPKMGAIQLVTTQ